MDARGDYDHRPLPYQQTVTGFGGLQTHPSVQTYSSLRPDLGEEYQFRVKMCTVVSVCFVANLLVTGILATCLFLADGPPRNENTFLQCQEQGANSEPYGMTSHWVDNGQGRVAVTCSTLTRENIERSVLQDCDQNLDDKLRIHLDKSNCQKTLKDGNSIKDWLVKLNHSSITFEADGRLRVRYSGIYVVYSSLAFVCKSKNNPETSETTYWQDIQVNGETVFRDAQMITPVTIPSQPYYCYRSLIHGLLKLKAEDRIRVQAGPPELLHCHEDMSYVGLYRP